ncbi:TEN1 (YLR010C) [Zygosaccharomyces parabailii]|uniref:BN860_09142g1_1 n=1 Tax=Zygosaccharomyces bailii (strain CLIB 213 / ATCC 58445 / CBS 680 / BCRC 21525 / NBRC 1098 / NCYC 1416 / NRRL Y-2227) TaxID=1333698 RepID=A0A8J2T3C7_ZYGB2|nr:TEN1 (YLR010C) [Zygosaccharomyces parabailii]CDF88392.1 BN860_09142g1_1 [Zygosaccharomyces bailii CLIB 213]CDH14726.1 uncharacterized protein ZBAI_06512 [Zygosaccharomyces bailii ISA1307]SJM82028.1 uncharacterized protein ZBIST_0260 [Zygosaccharomyces bailii]
MSQLVFRVDEYEKLACRQGSRYRIVGQLVDVDFCHQNTYVSLRSLPEFQNNAGKVLKAIVSPAVYESRFVKPSRKLQVGDCVSAWLVVYLENELQYWELLDISALTLRELESFRNFVVSSMGQQFLAVSSSST